MVWVNKVSASSHCGLTGIKPIHNHDTKLILINGYLFEIAMNVSDVFSYLFGRVSPSIGRWFARWSPVYNFIKNRLKTVIFCLNCSSRRD